MEEVLFYLGNRFIIFNLQKEIYQDKESYLYCVIKYII